MGYFSQDNIRALCGNNAKDKASVQAHFQALHKQVYNQLQLNDLDLSVVKSSATVVSHESISRHTTTDTDALTVQYMRSRSKAVTVEKLMGREEVAGVNNIIIRLHPVIELRLSEAGFCVELLLAPDAWWDQQNLKGKLAVQRHRHSFYTLLMELDPAFSMGFWQGIHYSDLRIAGKYFQHPRILDDWLGTFDPHADWFRLGIWYTLDDDALNDNAIVQTITDHIQSLYPVYQYILWTSNNNYRDFSD